MYDMSFEEWMECEEYYNEIDEIIDDEMTGAIEINNEFSYDYFDWYGEMEEIPFF